MAPSFVLVIGVGGGLVLKFLIPPVSKLRNRMAARATAAVWVGYAQLDGGARQEVPAVHDALAGLGSVYGHSLSPYGDTRLLGGRLSIHRDRIRWQPGLWLGRGGASPWELPVSDVADMSTVRRLAHARVVLNTAHGTIAFAVLDHEGLSEALDMVRSG